MGVEGVWLYKLQAHEGELNQMGGDLESRTEVLDKKKKEHFGSKQDQDRWQNARWKNHEMMSWRDIKLQWWASISCFPFDLGFLHLIWQPFRSPLDSAWRNLWQGTWRRNHQTTIEMRWRWRMRTQSISWATINIHDKVAKLPSEHLPRRLIHYLTLVICTVYVYARDH